MSNFYFAWVNSSETTFDPVEHARNDENVFSFTLSQTEGEHASLAVEILNPNVGFLSVGRKQWVWFSWDNGVEIEPLFFGRVLAVPEQATAQIVSLVFVARPSDFATVKSALADSLKVAPYYDPIWINRNLLNDPDTALEARPALWHVHRVTHELTASDIIEGGGNDYEIDDHFYDSLSSTYRARPANKVTLSAEVRWNNEGKGSIDITRQLVDAFIAAGSDRGPNYITTYTGDGLAGDWPAKDDSIGAGWSIGETTVPRVDGLEVKQLVWRVEDIKEPFIVIFPMFTFKPTLNVNYEVSRSYSEIVTFSFNADVQPLYADEDSEDVLELTLSTDSVSEPVDAGGIMPIQDKRRRSYFMTDRGKQSLEYLICYARAQLLARARCVELSFEVPFETVRNITCEDNVTIIDERIPGGSATGKVSGYTFQLDGDSGSLVAAVTISCTIGRGGAPITGSGGTPDYVESGYVESGYQSMSGGATAVAGAITYEPYSTPILDDGVDLTNLTPLNSIVSFVVVGGQAAQETAMGSRQFIDVQDVINELKNVKTEVALSLKPLTGGPFQTPIPVTVSDMQIPKTIDLE